MLDKAITEFLENKKQDYLNKKVKSNSSEEEKLDFTIEANEKYEFQSWLLLMMDTADAFFTTHPAKFTHSTPLSKTNKFKAKDLNIVANVDFAPDGMLKTGNVVVDMDLSGYPDNGNSTELYNFLKTELEDQKTVLEHLNNDSSYIKEMINSSGVDYERVKRSFIPPEKSSPSSSERLKQIYFPVGGDYHLLSTLSASGIIFKLKQKINDLRFSEQNKILRDELRKANPNPMQGKITDLYDLTAMGYGGTNAQNVGVLNNQNGGVSYLLSSLPPQLAKRQIQPPKTDFFDNCLWLDWFKTDFEQFHKVLSWHKNNIEIRDKRDDIVLNALSKVTRVVDKIRDIGVGWSDSETYDNLLLWQKIWLDEKYAAHREDKQQNQDYLTYAQSYFANWFIGHYSNVTKDSKLLGDDDIEHIKAILKQEQGLLK